MAKPSVAEDVLSGLLAWGRIAAGCPLPNLGQHKKARCRQYIAQGIWSLPRSLLQELVRF